MRLNRFNLYEAEDDIDDFDIVDDYIEDDDYPDLDSANYEEVLDTLKTISDKLNVSGRRDRRNDNVFIYSVSANVKVNVEFYDTVQSIDTEIVNKTKSGNDYNIYVDCTDDITEISNISDYMNTAALLIKEIQDKLM